MTRILKRWACVAALGLPVMSAATVATVEPLAWLGGCWAADGGEPGSVEHWLAPAGGTLLGVSRTVRNGRTVAHEFMLIRRNAAGTVEYVASPSGQKTTAFALVRVADGEAVFENLQHDFPQRIVYALTAPGRLAARIEGTTGAGPKVVHFPMTRTRCEP